MLGYKFLLAALYSIHQPVNANPVPLPPVIAEVPCDPISKYSSQWFLGNTKAEWAGVSIDSNALFYTAGLSSTARKYSKTGGSHLVTIWDVWPCWNYWIKQTRNNPLRCIMSSVADELTYFENMSRAFAMKCNIFATVMHRNIYNPPLGTIWGRIEKDRLKRTDNPGGIVNMIVAIDAEDPSLEIIEWQRRASKRAAAEDAPNTRNATAVDDGLKTGLDKREWGYCWTEAEYAEMYDHFEDNW